MGLCDLIDSPISPQPKAWVLALWRVIWKSINDYVFKDKEIRPSNTLTIARNLANEFNILLNEFPYMLRAQTKSLN